MKLVVWESQNLKVILRASAQNDKFKDFAESNKWIATRTKFARNDGLIPPPPRFCESQNLARNPKNFMLKFPAPQKAYLFGVVCDCFCAPKEESPDY